MKTLAIYPGSFSPFTIGHQNILEKAEKIFDEVIVAVGINPEKIKSIPSDKNEREDLLNSIKDARVDVISKQLENKKVEGYTGFLTDYVREKEAEGYIVIVIRGLRNGYDFDYEYTNIRYALDQKPDLNFVLIPCDPLFLHVSSSAYRAIESVQSGAGHNYLARKSKN